MIDFEILKNEGFFTIDSFDSPKQLLDIAATIGNIFPHPNGELLAVLTANDGINSLPGTFSQKFGFGEFPMHTDTSFLGKPVRYLVLAMLDKSNCSTNYIPINNILNRLSNEMIALGKKSVYLIDTFEGKKYTSLFFNYNDENGFRFDPNIMTPVNKSAKEFNFKLLEVLNTIEKNTIFWSGNKAVVIDNWKNLHSRSPLEDINLNRKLLRIYVENK